MRALLILVLLALPLDLSAARPPQSCNCIKNEKGACARSWAARQAFLRQSGYPHGRPGYVVDHRVSLCCGGADHLSNMQWQTAVEARAKDRLELLCVLDIKPTNGID